MIILQLQQQGLKTGCQELTDIKHRMKLLMNKLKLNTLAIALGLGFSGVTQAASNSEVTQLRNEVSQLRAMLEQMQVEQKKQAIVYDVQATKVVFPQLKLNLHKQKKGLVLQRMAPSLICMVMSALMQVINLKVA